MSWSTIKTEAIILSVYSTREVDRVYRALTPKYGKVEFTGRGGQKILAKLAPHLEPFAITDIEIVKGKRSNTIISVERKFAFNGIANDLQSRTLALSSLVLLDKYTNVGDQDEALYHMLSDWLTFLNAQKDLNQGRSIFLLGSFILRLIERLGYEIEFSRCLSCKKQVKENEYRWHPGRGGLVCRVCSADAQDWFAAREISQEALKILRFARLSSYQDLLKLSLTGELIEAYAETVHNLVLTHIPTYFDRPFWSGVIRLENMKKY